MLGAAAPAAAQAPATPGVFGAFFALLLVLGLILGLAWLLRRLPGAGLRPADGLRVVASLQLGAKERAVVVEVGGQQLLLGVTPAGISRLHELPQPLPPVAPAKLPSLPNLKELPNFAQLLSQRLRKDA
ncbi:flagellar biosynthetic protein FliO [Pseudoxanthomonas suwonensis]|uniref:Flagellar protein n=1 Tax=Pseudoxanthomonas suwonensis TaxID=314722 RepID=A0A0E3Z4K3_9GAMM|nr:flagellar biosynthetic protein FliO [Pseudoxanthomonas suwonensis]AKC87977.1 flagellar protein [Pseudoxanthomonas suwonensis]